MPRKGEMSDQDAYEETIRASADHYNVVLFIPQSNSRVRHETKTLAEAIEYGENVWNDDQLSNVRAAMIYAVNDDERFALVGTCNCFNPKFKPVKVKIY